MRLRPALSTLALAPLAVGLLSVSPAPHAAAATAQPAPTAIEVVQTGYAPLPDVQGGLDQVATGYWQTLGLSRSGQVVAGGNSYGAVDVPAGLGDTVQLASGYRHALALDAHGDVTAWGHWGDGDQAAAATVPQAVQDADVVQVSAGNLTDLAVTADGEVLSWGAPGQPAYATDVPAAVADLDVASAYVDYHAAAVLSTDGKVVSWGAVGPAPSVLADKTVVALSVGRFNAIAQTSDGALVAWGEDFTGVNALPAEVTAGKVTAFDVGDVGAMAATDDGVLHEWGQFDRPIKPATSGARIQDVQVDRYSATLVYATLANDTLPEITGDSTVGGTLSVSTGTWSEQPDAFHYRWTRDGVDVGTDSPTYDLTAADANGDVNVLVTAIAGDVRGATYAASGVHVQPATFTTAPGVAITGVPRVGRTLTATVTDATPQPDSYSYAWFRDGEYLGVETPTYRLTAADLGHRITVGVYAVRDGYHGQEASSAPVRVAVGAAAFRVAAPAKVRRGATLAVKATGLAAREVYTVVLDGKTLLRSRADSAGRVTKTVRVARTARTGRRVLAVVGSYADRTGRRTVVVTR